MTAAQRTGLARKAGLSPGTLIHIGSRIATSTRIRVIDYTPSELIEREVANVAACSEFTDPGSVTWINVDGLHDVELIDQIGKLFSLHPLLLEDILHTRQRPKADDMEECMFIVLKMLFFRNGEQNIWEEQVSLVVGPGFVISFQEQEGDIFDPVRERIRHGQGRIRTMREDYLAYALIDTIVDEYFIILEQFSDRVEALEEVLITDPRPESLKSIYQLKKQIIQLRRSIWPLREVVSSLLRGESKHVHQPTLVFLRDLYDHTIQVIDIIETLREVISGLLEIYLSSLSNRMNEVMKTLTIMASIFIPLTFIAGIYGMNFSYMPELEAPLGYPIALTVMAIVGFSMAYYFRKRNWF